MKDRFSDHAAEYQKFRPTYPSELYAFLLATVSENKIVWDCGTGNGQVAKDLSHYFKYVYATDISENQLKQAPILSNVIYIVEPAEATSFLSQHFDLITVAQAIHWFDFSLFYKEVKRTLKPNGILAVMGYGLLQVDDEIDVFINHFYYETIGSYWDKERKYIDDRYETIPFPFEEIPSPAFYQTLEWERDQFVGYLSTWSAVQHYIKANDSDPIELIDPTLLELWPKGTKKKVTFPILLRVGKP